MPPHTHDHAHRKLPGIIVESDDFEVEFEGEVYYPHSGEYVVISQAAPVSLIKAYTEFRRLSVEQAALEGEPDAQERLIELLDPAYDRILDLLSERIRSWTWTDDDEQPHPQPYRQPEVLRALSDKEVMYLLNLTMNGAPADRKNGSSASPTSTSATALVPTAGATSTTARSRTKRS